MEWVVDRLVVDSEDQEVRSHNDQEILYVVNPYTPTVFTASFGPGGFRTTRVHMGGRRPATAGAAADTSAAADAPGLESGAVGEDERAVPGHTEQREELRVPGPVGRGAGERVDQAVSGEPDGWR